MPRSVKDDSLSSSESEELWSPQALSPAELLQWSLVYDRDPSPPREKQQQAADGAALRAKKKEAEGMVAPAKAHGGETNSVLSKEQLDKRWRELMGPRFFPRQQAADGKLCAKKKEAEGLQLMQEQEQKLPPQDQKELAEKRIKLANELAEKRNKLTYRSCLFKDHPDIVRLTKKTRPDLDSPNGQNVFFLPTDGDNDIQSEDERLFYIPDSSLWLRKCLEEWELTDNDLKDKVRAEKNRFEIFSASFCSKGGVGSGCGAIIRDAYHRPIVARSEVGKSVSEFCLELQEVALGLELAVKYEVFSFYFYCSSDWVEVFIMEFLGGASRHNYSHGGKIDDDSKEYIRKWDRKAKLDDTAFEIMEKIIKCVNKLEDMGLGSFSVMSGGNGYGGGYKEGAAYFLAQLGKDQELKVKEIGEAEGLWNTIYQEVFG